MMIDVGTLAIVVVVVVSSVMLGYFMGQCCWTAYRTKNPVYMYCAACNRLMGVSGRQQPPHLLPISLKISKPEDTRRPPERLETCNKAQDEEEQQARLDDMATFHRLGIRQSAIPRLEIEARQLETRALSPIQASPPAETSGFPGMELLTPSPVVLAAAQRSCEQLKQRSSQASNASESINSTSPDGRRRQGKNRDPLLSPQHAAALKCGLPINEAAGGGYILRPDAVLWSAGGQKRTEVGGSGYCTPLQPITTEAAKLSQVRIIHIPPVDPARPDSSGKKPATQTPHNASKKRPSLRSSLLSPSRKSLVKLSNFVLPERPSKEARGAELLNNEATSEDDVSTPLLPLEDRSTDQKQVPNTGNSSGTGSISRKSRRKGSPGNTATALEIVGKSSSLAVFINSEAKPVATESHLRRPSDRSRLGDRQTDPQPPSSQESQVGADSSAQIPRKNSSSTYNINNNNEELSSSALFNQSKGSGGGARLKTASGRKLRKTASTRTFMSGYMAVRPGFSDTDITSQSEDERGRRGTFARRGLLSLPTPETGSQHHASSDLHRAEDNLTPEMARSEEVAAVDSARRPDQSLHEKSQQTSVAQISGGRLVAPPLMCEPARLRNYPLEAPPASKMFEKSPLAASQSAQQLPRWATAADSTSPSPLHVTIAMCQATSAEGSHFVNVQLTPPPDASAADTTSATSRYGQQLSLGQSGTLSNYSIGGFAAMGLSTAMSLSLADFQLSPGKSGSAECSSDLPKSSSASYRHEQDELLSPMGAASAYQQNSSSPVVFHHQSVSPLISPIPAENLSQHATFLPSPMAAPSPSLRPSVVPVIEDQAQCCTATTAPSSLIQPSAALEQQAQLSTETTAPSPVLRPSSDALIQPSSSATATRSPLLRPGAKNEHPSSSVPLIQFSPCQLSNPGGLQQEKLACPASTPSPHTTWLPSPGTEEPLHSSQSFRKQDHFHTSPSQGITSLSQLSPASGPVSLLGGVQALLLRDEAPINPPWPHQPPSHPLPRARSLQLYAHPLSHHVPEMYGTASISLSPTPSTSSPSPALLPPHPLPTPTAVKHRRSSYQHPLSDNKSGSDLDPASKIHCLSRHSSKRRSPWTGEIDIARPPPFKSPAAHLLSNRLSADPLAADQPLPSPEVLPGYRYLQPAIRLPPLADLSPGHLPAPHYLPPSRGSLVAEEDPATSIEAEERSPLTDCHRGLTGSRESLNKHRQNFLSRKNRLKNSDCCTAGDKSRRAHNTRRDLARNNQEEQDGRGENGLFRATPIWSDVDDVSTRRASGSSWSIEPTPGGSSDDVFIDDHIVDHQSYLVDDDRHDSVASTRTIVPSNYGRKNGLNDLAVYGHDDGNDAARFGVDGGRGIALYGQDGDHGAARAGQDDGHHASAREVSAGRDGALPEARRTSFATEFRPRVNSLVKERRAQFEEKAKAAAVPLPSRKRTNSFRNRAASEGHVALMRERYSSTESISRTSKQSSMAWDDYNSEPEFSKHRPGTGCSSTTTGTDDDNLISSDDRLYRGSQVESDMEVLSGDKLLL